MRSVELCRWLRRIAHRLRPWQACRSTRIRRPYARQWSVHGIPSHEFVAHLSQEQSQLYAAAELTLLQLHLRALLQTGDDTASDSSMATALPQCRTKTDTLTCMDGRRTASAIP